MSASECLMQRIEKLTAGGGVTSPDDMVNIDDVRNVVEEYFRDVYNENYGHVCEKVTDYISFLNMVTGKDSTITLDIPHFRSFLCWIRDQLEGVRE